MYAKTQLQLLQQAQGREGTVSTRDAALKGHARSDTGHGIGHVSDLSPQPLVHAVLPMSNVGTRMISYLAMICHARLASDESKQMPVLVPTLQQRHHPA
mmetsp:Transcript_55558/g.124168  ORF Transcript_55558/g.124168 Transcript_55558/m.124168 type:complete len:99 (+) Transcript_55558:141-437(+)